MQVPGESRRGFLGSLKPELEAFELPDVGAGNKLESFSRATCA